MFLSNWCNHRSIFDVNRVFVPFVKYPSYNRFVGLLILLFASHFCNAQLVASFTSDTTSGCAPLIIKFQDQSTGSPTQWKWDLGNGTLSTQQNPTGTYFNPGTYSVELIAINAAGTDTIKKLSYITVYETPTAAFVGSPLTGCYPLKVQFNDLSTANSGTISQWTWDFGDGNLSTQQSPQHTYNVAGNFGVTLQIKNSFGCVKVLNKINYIKINGGAIADFGFTTNTGCGAPATVNFTNNSTGTGTLSYQWDFGNGNTSTATNPTNVYNTNGVYTVTLITISNQGCRDTLIKTNAITIGSVTPNFTTVGNCQGTGVVFNNTSTPAPTSVSWNFGDGNTSTVINPVHVFANAGIFPVKMVSNFGVCKDSITIPLNILPKPTATFGESNPLGACTPPLNVSFNSSVAASSYQWFFGDGGTSTQQNPAHNYITSGLFDVKLVVTNASGCTDTLTKIELVKIAPPKITSFPGLPHKGCAPYTANITPAITSPENIVSYQWDFGDGSPAGSGQNVTHNYNNVGSYNITLIITTVSGCTDTFTLVGAVQLSSKPTAAFSATPRNACAKDDIIFTDQSTGTIDEWNWNFGDGGSSSNQNPTYNYTDTGFFNVQLIVKNGFCADTLEIKRYIFINPPIANFVTSFTCDTIMQRRFTDFSIGATVYTWDFGDGNGSNVPSPVHTYAATGSYIVKLSVTNGICTHEKTDSITIINLAPDFTVNGSSFCKYANVAFTVNSPDTNFIRTYNWDYGDGTTDSTHSPTITHSYLQSGNVFPSLITTDISGCFDTVKKAIPIIIYGPTAGFTNPPGTCIKGIIPFTDTSKTDGIHPIQSWIWEYGDGFKDTLSASTTVQHQYDTAGLFTVKLSVFDSFGCRDTALIPAAVLITNPKASFNTPDTIICTNSNVNFINTSQGVGLNFNWDFGDGNTSTSTQPTHAYPNQGFYNIQLSLSDIFGCKDTLTRPQYIHVANVHADFKFLQGDVLGLCYPYLIQLANQSQFSSSISWNFGDGSFSNLDTPSHFYNYVGTYPLTLTAKGFGTCVDDTTVNITVRGPIGSFTYGPLNFCTPTTVNFVGTAKNNATFVWDFSDGVIVSTSDSIISHSYQTAGLFKPKMILIDATGCTVPITGANTIRAADVKTFIKMPQNSFCDSVKLNLLDSTEVFNDVVTKYLWKFGDNDSSALQNPTHNYTVPANYTITLKVTTSLGCTSIDTVNVPLSIIQTPTVQFAGNVSACVNDSLKFNALVIKSDGKPITWLWNFANGNTSNQQSPPKQAYSNAGNYTVSLFATNQGCTDTVQTPIVINPLPTIDAGPDAFVCKGSSIQLNPSGGVSYVWDANTTLSCTNCTAPFALPTDTSLYKVTGYNSFGCFKRDSIVIAVLHPFTIQVSNGDTLCQGQSTNLLVTGGNALDYTWTPTTGLNNSAIANPIANPSVTTNYMVVAKDGKNCFKDTGYILISVFEYPKFNIVESTISANVGNNFTIATTNSPDIISWKWTPERWLNCYTCAQPTGIATDNIKYTAVVKNAGGCSSKDEVQIVTLCNNANIYIPNTFSPNGDGMNDVFYPRGKGLFNINHIRIFNRWGELVFERSDFKPNDATSGWDGTHKGVKLSADVYMYTMEIACDNSKVIPVKGDITLLR